MFRTDQRLAQFTPKCLTAFEKAACNAIQYGEHYIDTLDAVFGLASVRNGVAPRVLRGLGVTPEALKGIYVDLYGRGNHRKQLIEELEFCPDVDTSVSRAIEIAEGFESPFVDDGFLLLAISELRSTFGMRQLRRLGIHPEDLTLRICSQITAPIAVKEEELNLRKSRISTVQLIA